MKVVGGYMWETVWAEHFEQMKDLPHHPDPKTQNYTTHHEIIKSHNASEKVRQSLPGIEPRLCVDCRCHNGPLLDGGKYIGQLSET